MNNYLAELKRELYFFSEDEIDQIIEEFEELFASKQEQGLNEQQIIETLDAPKVVAENYAKEFQISTSGFTKSYVNTQKNVKTFLKDVNDKANSAIDTSREKYESNKAQRAQEKEEKAFEEDLHDADVFDKQNESQTTNDDVNTENNDQDQSTTKNDEPKKAKAKKQKTTKNTKSFDELFSKYIVYPIFYIVYIGAKLVELMMKVTVTAVWASAFISYLLSLIFIDFNVFTLQFRLLETIMFITLSICCYIIFSIKLGKHE